MCLCATVLELVCVYPYMGMCLIALLLLSFMTNKVEYIYIGCASGCVVECRICRFESRPGLLRTRSTHPSIPPGSVNEYQLRLGRQMQVWLIPIVDERVGVQVKLWKPLRTRAIPERFCGGDSLRWGAISIVCTFTFTFYLYHSSSIRRPFDCLSHVTHTNSDSVAADPLSYLLCPAHNRRGH